MFPVCFLPYPNVLTSLGITSLDLSAFSSTGNWRHLLWPPLAFLITSHNSITKFQLAVIFLFPYIVLKSDVRSIKNNSLDTGLWCSWKQAEWALYFDGLGFIITLHIKVVSMFITEIVQNRLSNRSLNNASSCSGYKTLHDMFQFSYSLCNFCNLINCHFVNWVNLGWLGGMIVMFLAQIQFLQVTYWVYSCNGFNLVVE